MGTHDTVYTNGTNNIKGVKGARGDSLLPQDVTAEAALLGACLIDPELVVTCRWLDPLDFYTHVHREIWAAMQTLMRSGTTPDMVTLINHLNASQQLADLGGVGYVTSLANQVPNTRNAPAYAQIIAEKAAYRRVIDAAGKIAAAAYSEVELDELRLESFKTLRFALAKRELARAQLLPDVVRQLQEQTLLRMDGVTNGLLPTGIWSIDQQIKGFEAGQLIIVAGRPRTGKSMVGQQLILEIAQQLIPLGQTIEYLTLEMTNLQQVSRVLVSEAHHKNVDIDLSNIRQGFRYTDERKQVHTLDTAFAEFNAVAEYVCAKYGNIYLLEQRLTVNELRLYLEDVVATRGCKVLLIDQLDLMKKSHPKLDDREHVSEVSLELKAMAKDLGITIIALVQLNRDLEKRPGILNKRPRLSDLYMSGRLEMDADMIFFLFRPSLYDDSRSQDNWFSHYMEIGIGKDRNGVSEYWIPIYFSGAGNRVTAWPMGCKLPELEPGTPNELLGPAGKVAVVSQSDRQVLEMAETGETSESTIKSFGHPPIDD